MKTLLHSNKCIHEDILENLIKSPQHYFDTTPDGKILNKISNDLGILDGGMTESFADIASRIVMIPFALGTIIYVDKVFLIPAILVCVLNIFNVMFAKDAFIFTRKIFQ